MIYIYYIYIYICMSQITRGYPSAIKHDLPENPAFFFRPMICPENKTLHCFLRGFFS